MSALRGYLLGVVCTAMLCSAVLTVIPKGNVRRTACYVCGLLLLLATLRPLAHFDAESVSCALARVQMEQEAAVTGVEVKNRELVLRIISEKTSAYILDKAESLGLSLSVSVQAEDDGGGPRLASVFLTGSAEESAKNRLTEYIEDTFGIPKERQIWNEGSTLKP